MEERNFREEIKYNAEEEFEATLEQVSKQYGYDEELTRVLTQIYRTNYQNASFEMKQNFIQTIREVPIVVIDKVDEDTIGQLRDHFLGKERITIQGEESEYSSTIGNGAYCTLPEISEDGQLVGKKSFIYVTRLSSYHQEVIDKLGTSIHVPHLIHELGHAQAARVDEYTQNGNTIIQRCGMIETQYDVVFVDGRPILKENNSNGIYLEEATNTVFEYDNMAKFLGIKPEEVDEAIYRGIGIHGLVPSTYHGLMDEIARKMQKVIGRQGIEQIRFFNSSQAKSNFNKMAEKTKYWQKGVHSETEMQKKRDAFAKPASEKWKEFCQKNSETYFGVRPFETPMQKIDNVLRQIYDMKMIKYNIPVEEYSNIMQSVIVEAYYILNGMDEMSKEQKEK